MMLEVRGAFALEGAVVNQPNHSLLLTLVIAIAAYGLAEAQSTRREAGHDDPFGLLKLPDAWSQRFWANPDAGKLLEMEPREVAALVPVQSGLRFCRCPSCGAPERDETLTWTLQQPLVLKCRRCGILVPNDRYPAKVKDQIPEELVEVVPGVVHRYPYHSPEESAARIPDERLYLRARVDYETRKFLAQAALHASVSARSEKSRESRERFEKLACVILLKFAHVYPQYAVHHDQPDLPKILQPARLHPPYSRGYLTAKWDWSGSLEVPLDLLMAYSLIRDCPAWKAIGELLDDPSPRRTIERDFFLAASEFCRDQPREFMTESLAADRSLLAVARLLRDGKLGSEARRRLAEDLQQGFYHDGFWRDGDIRTQQGILRLLDGWVADELAKVEPGAAAFAIPDPSPMREGRSGIPILELARRNEAAFGMQAPLEPVRQASMPFGGVAPGRRRPFLLGGAGIAQLVLGEGNRELSVEVRGRDSLSRPRFDRLALRVSIGGVPVIDDLEAHGSTGTGWEVATPSHNLAVVDGLNQRETPQLAGEPAGGSNLLFYAADPDFQVVSFGDPRAYPSSTSRYRRTIVLTQSKGVCYAVDVFEVGGGLQHDQLFHAAPGRGDTWSISVAKEPAPRSLLPGTIRFLPEAPVSQGRWFVQSYGEFRPETQAGLSGPTVARLSRHTPQEDLDKASSRAIPREADGLEVRLHILGEFPLTAIEAFSPEPAKSDVPVARRGTLGRSSLILRRRSQRGETLRSSFVTVIEPSGPAFHPIRRVGRVESAGDVVVLMIETGIDTEYLLVNLEPGTTRRAQLPSGKYVTFDGVALRVRDASLALAGGTFAEGSGRLASMSSIDGILHEAVRDPTPEGGGWFLTSAVIEDLDRVSGRCLVVEHGDGSRRAWTINSVKPAPKGTRLFVCEEPGFRIDPNDGTAHYYQFPQVLARGPHRFSVARIARSDP